MTKAAPTDEQIEVFGQAFWPVNARTKIDANREELRAALATLLASQEAEIAELREALTKVHDFIANTAWASENIDDASDIDNLVCAALRPAETGDGQP